MFGRFVVRKLARQAGDNPESRMRAVKLVADRDPRAKQALLEVMEERPVLASRAPVLHKFGIMGFEPVLVPGKTIRLSPSTTSTFGADFDGDCMNVHAVVTPEAVREVRERMLPSKNIRSPANFGPLYTPRHEFLYGLYAATTKRNSGKLPTVFRRVSDALAAYRRGELDIDDEVHIVDPPK
jgi:DNA-directed RNA polymerase subunit beta'